MKTKTDKKEAQLGMPFGTASHRLRKKMTLYLLTKLNENTCYRCLQPITDANDLSMDHKQNWLNVNTDLFWDTDNIAFSHKSCNYKHESNKRVKRIISGKLYCKQCNTYKYVSKFNKNKRTTLGYASTCRECSNRQKREKYHNDKNDK